MTFSSLYQWTDKEELDRDFSFVFLIFLLAEAAVDCWSEWGPGDWSEPRAGGGGAEPCLLHRWCWFHRSAPAGTGELASAGPLCTVYGSLEKFVFS